MSKGLHLRTSDKQLTYWQVAAIAQGFTNFSEWVRVALTEKAQQTPAVLAERMEDLARQIEEDKARENV